MDSTCETGLRTGPLTFFGKVPLGITLDRTLLFKFNKITVTKYKGEYHCGKFCVFVENRGVK